MRALISILIGVASRALRLASAVTMMLGSASRSCLAAEVISDAFTVLILILFAFIASLTKFRASRMASVITAPEAFLTLASPVILVLPWYMSSMLASALALIAALRSASSG